MSCSARYDIRFEYILCITLGSQNAIMDNMQVHTSFYINFALYYQYVLSVCEYFLYEREVILIKISSMFYHSFFQQDLIFQLLMISKILHFAKPVEKEHRFAFLFHSLHKCKIILLRHVAIYNHILEYHFPFQTITKITCVMNILNYKINLLDSAKIFRNQSNSSLAEKSIKLLE